MKSRVFSWVIGSVLVLAALFLLMNTVNYKLNGTGRYLGYGYGGDNPPSEKCSQEQKPCGVLCCDKSDKCDKSYPVCCPEGYKIYKGICLVECPKDQKSCGWGCCPKNSICGTAEGLCIIDKKCPAGTSDCPADDPADSAKDCCKPSETCINTGGIWAVYFCSAFRCNANQELCGINLPPGAPKLPIPGDFAICCDKGTCSHFPAGQPYCKKDSTKQAVQGLIDATPAAQNSKPAVSKTKNSFWKKILRTFKVE